MDSPTVSKEFLTYSEQLDKLESKGLAIKHKADAERILMRTSYFALISGYKDIFKNKENRRYKPEAEFGDIYALYIFDELMRSTFLMFILKVERNIKSSYSYAFCEKFGDSQAQYLNTNNYNYEKHQQGVNKLINIFNEIIVGKRDGYGYIKHHSKKYKNVPLWVLVNKLTLGNVSKMYQYSDGSLRSAVAKQFDGIFQKELESFLSVLSKFRNVCAHNERLYSYKTQDSIKNLPIHNHLSLPKKGNEYRYGKSDLFSVVIIFRYLLDESDFDIFLSFLDVHMEQLDAMSYKNEILNAMGFPENWRAIRNLTQDQLRG